MATVKHEDTSTPQGGGLLNWIVILVAIVLIYVAIQAIDKNAVTDMTDAISSSIEELGD